MTNLQKLEKALEDYKQHIEPWWKRLLCINDDPPIPYRDGLCYYFKYKFADSCLPESLKEAFKTTWRYKYLRVNPSGCYQYWYGWGRVSPRVKMLKKAIKIEKKKSYA